MKNRERCESDDTKRIQRLHKKKDKKGGKHCRPCVDGKDCEILELILVPYKGTETIVVQIVSHL
jgi:hypothetical protein